MNVLAVCAVFVFVGAVLLGAFWVQAADDYAKPKSPVRPATQYDTGERLSSPVFAFAEPLVRLKPFIDAW